MIDKLSEFLDSMLFRYVVMACFIVAIEVAVFVVLNSLLNVPYIIATPLSMFVGIALNWYFSKIYVFRTSIHAPAKEFLLVLVASLVGVMIQMVVVSIAVEILLQLPLVGKIAAIFVTFIWNFLIRKHYIFKS